MPLLIDLEIWETMRAIVPKPPMAAVQPLREAVRGGGAIRRIIAAMGITVIHLFLNAERKLHRDLVRNLAPHAGCGRIVQGRLPSIRLPGIAPMWSDRRTAPSQTKALPETRPHAKPQPMFAHLPVRIGAPGRAAGARRPRDTCTWLGHKIGQAVIRRRPNAGLQPRRSSRAVMSGEYYSANGPGRNPRRDIPSRTGDDNAAEGRVPRPPRPQNATQAGSPGIGAI